MENLAFNLQLLMPNLMLGIGSLVLLTAGLWVRNAGFLNVIASTFVLFAAITAIPLLQIPATTYFDGFVFHDPFSLFFTFLLLAIMFFSLTMGRYSKEILPDRKSEYYALLLALATGLLFMASSNHFLMIYLGIETVSVLSYTLAGFHRERSDSIEASMKYVVYGALATGIMIFGFSLIYATSGELTILGLRNFVGQNPMQNIPSLFWAGVVFSFAGFGYKISAAPMHMWTPDVYEGSPTPVAALFSVAPKIAGFAALIRFFVVGLSIPVSNTTSVLSATTSGAQIAYSAAGHIPWTYFFILSSVYTMFMGNLAALGQTSVKRILAYSAIAHAGYMLLGLTTQNREGLMAILFYTVVYCTMNLGAFWVVSIVEDELGGDSLEHFKGLGRRAPLPAILMAIFLFSLVGLPPFAGFIGKLYIFLAILGQHMYGLALIAAVNSVISLYYYAKILKAMFLEKSDNEQPIFEQKIPSTILVYISMLVIPNLILGIYWEPAMTWASNALIFAR